MERPRRHSGLGGDCVSGDAFDPQRTSEPCCRAAECGTGCCLLAVTKALFDDHPNTVPNLQTSATLQRSAILCDRTHGTETRGVPHTHARQMPEQRDGESCEQLRSLTPPAKLTRESTWPDILCGELTVICSAKESDGPAPAHLAGFVHGDAVGIEVRTRLRTTSRPSHHRVLLTQFLDRGVPVSPQRRGPGRTVCAQLARRHCGRQPDPYDSLVCRPNQRFTHAQALRTVGGSRNCLGSHHLHQP